MKKKNWFLEVDGNKYKINFIPNSFSAKHKLYINGKEMLIKQSFKEQLIGIDYGFRLGDKKAHLVIQGQADLAVDGYFLDSKRPYAPLAPMPGWAWIYIILGIAMPVVSLGGAIPGALGFLTAMFNAKISVIKEYSAIKKIFLCTLFTTIAWAMFLLFLYYTTDFFNNM